MPVTHAMPRNPLAAETAPTLSSVLDALDDPDCRAIVGALDEPMTAEEIADARDIPRSTVYRKLDLLEDAGLVSRFTEVRRDGSHTARYETDFEEVRVSLDGDRSLSASIKRDRDGERPDERLETLWTEVRNET
jgi:DNA-binding transcriptional ArsR family regulator